MDVANANAEMQPADEPELTLAQALQAVMVTLADHTAEICSLRMHVSDHRELLPPKPKSKSKSKSKSSPKPCLSPR
jgi:hypothetical protein